MSEENLMRLYLRYLKKNYSKLSPDRISRCFRTHQEWDKTGGMGSSEARRIIERSLNG